MKCENEPSTKALQDAVIRACVGLEVVPQQPLEGDHMANGRVEMAVREVRNDNAELSEFPLSTTQLCVSQMTVRYSVSFLALQRKS